MPFPPIPAYPNAVDSDYTLFLVYNTTETKLCADNPAWAETIEILPVASDKPEIWADNGFGNIDGELFYYDSVGKDSNGKVNKLKGCARALSGKSKFNPRGTWVRSYVIAEHHNQLVDAILKVENFVGFNFDPRQETLDWRIRNLQSLAIIFDDYACPDVNFTFNIVENDKETGILANYVVELTQPTTANSFRLDFGDGEFTTTALSGSHRYALNATIDPVVTLSNDKCQIIVTPVERENPSEPPAVIEDVFDIPIPAVPDVPDFTFVPCEVPEPNINLPPLVFPCLSLEGQVGPLPSVIIGPDIQLVSNVVIEGPDNPVQILHSTVTIEGGFSLPSIIFVDVPPTIVIDPPIPPTIVIVAQSSIAMGIDYGELPKFEIDWSNMPEMTMQMTMVRPVVKPQLMAQGVQNEFGEEFADLFQASEQLKVEYETVGIPEEIRVIMPDEIPDIKVDATDVPKTIKLVTEDVNLPDIIRIFGPDKPLPEVISIHGPEVPLPDQIELVNRDVPRQIDLVNKDVPHEIVLRTETPIPEKILVEMVQPIPSKIILDASGVPTSLPVTGIPESLTVVGFPEGIPILFPKEEDMPKIELVYKGAPLELKITMDKMIAAAEGEDAQCVRIIPCVK
jgi:hypothetical protein